MSKCDEKSKQLFDQYLKNNKITVMSTIGCPACVDAKKLLESSKLIYGTIDLSDDENEKLFHCLYDITKSHYVPQIFINNKYIGGYRELSYLHNTGLLKDLYLI